MSVITAECATPGPSAFTNLNADSVKAFLESQLIVPVEDEDPEESVEEDESEDDVDDDTVV